jgi:tetratricopeptide (TPR) repeat protein
MNYDHIEQKIKEAVAVRETGDIKKSRAMFEEILSELREEMKEDSSKELKYIFATATGEYIIQCRVEGPEHYEDALKLAADLLYFDKQNRLNNPLSVRAVSNTLLNMELYKEAGPFLEALIPLYENNSAQEGDTKAHLAFCYLNLRSVDEAAHLIDEALELIKKNTAKKEEMFISTWLSHAHIVKTLVLSAQSKIQEAKNQAEKAIQTANKGKNKRRIDQAKRVLEYLEKTDGTSSTKKAKSKKNA